MPFSAGNKLTAAQLNNLAVKTYEAVCTGAVTIGTSLVDVTGASVTFTTATNNAVAVVHWSADHSISVASAGTIAIVQLMVDGVDSNSRQSLKDLRTLDRVTIYQKSRLTLATAGSHTIKLRTQKTGAGGTDALQPDHTGLVVAVYEVV